MIPQRLIFNFIQLRHQTGQPVIVLPDLIGVMEVVSVEVTDDKDNTKKDIIMTRIFTPFGQAYLVYETPKEILLKIDRATMEAAKGLQQSLANQLVVAK